jgi:monolysocardiolipin acyltransferase
MREQQAVSRWKPGHRWYYPLLTALVIAGSRFITRTLNSLVIEELERFESLRQRGCRGLLTFSNHVSLFDDPLLVSNFGVTRCGEVRWVAADAMNFFGSRWEAWLFTAGKCVPVVRGAGLDQPGLHYLGDRLREGGWVHIFPEVGRASGPRALMTYPLKSGIGRLIAEAMPIALPFYHYGMHGILPTGAKLPRRGKTVRLVFGEPLDCGEEFLRNAALRKDGAHLTGQALWEALAERCYDSLRRLELLVNPAAAAPQ